MIGPRKRREIVGKFAQMYNHRSLAAFHTEHERQAERDALDLCCDLDRDVVQAIKSEAHSNYAALAEDQDRREKRRR